MKWYRAFAIELIAAALTLPWVALAYLYIVSTTPPIEYDSEQYFDPAVVTPGETTLIVRKFTIRRPVTLWIIRNFERRDSDGSLEVMEGVDVKASYQTGQYLQRRLFEVPDRLTPGDWTLHNTVIWEDWPGFVHSMPAAPIQFKVVAKKED